MERNNLGQFIVGHSVKSGWGFSKGNTFGIGKSYLRGKRVSPNTEFKKGHPTWNKGKHHSVEQIKKMKENHHGMTGLHHSEETKIKMSLAKIGIKLPFSIRENMSKSKVRFILNNPSFQIGHGRGHGGIRIIGGKKQYFRSNWEANAARVLNFQKREWEYEKKTFWFDKIKRGTRFYIPDFYLPKENLYIEVKGYMDSRSKTKLNRMKKYYPKIKIEIWDKDFFRIIKNQGIVNLISDWE